MVKKKMTKIILQLYRHRYEEKMALKMAEHVLQMQMRISNIIRYRARKQRKKYFVCAQHYTFTLSLITMAFVIKSLSLAMSQK